jgi:6-phosphogluconolactonase
MFFMTHSVEIIEPRLFSGAVADEIAQSLKESIADRGRASLVLSGGSTPAAVYKALSVPPRVTEVDWSKVLVFWGDERFVPHTDNASNFRMADTQLLSQIRESKLKVFPVPTIDVTPESAARQYEETIVREVGIENGMPRFDLILLGMGEDGHTASLFPGSRVLSEQKKLVVNTEHPTDGTVRISINRPLLLSARQLIYIVSGQQKANTVRKVLEGTGTYEELPATLYKDAQGRVQWFLDTTAASKLPHVKP